MAKTPSDQFVPIPGAKMLEAIGTVAVKWSALEFQIDNILYWASSPHDAEVQRILNGQGVQQRWDRLKKILREEYTSQPGTSKLMSLIDRGLSIKGERDRIMHGLYAAPDSPNAKAEAVILALKNHKVRAEWPVTRPRVLDAANKIDRLLSEIINHLLDHGERIGNSILPNAWRHADHK
jgi:hypothetical protein